MEFQIEGRDRETLVSFFQIAYLVLTSYYTSLQMYVAQDLILYNFTLHLF